MNEPAVYAMSYVETQVVPLLDTSKLAGAVTVILPAVGFKFSAVSEKVCAEELVPVVTLPNASEEGDIHELEKSSFFLLFNAYSGMYRY